MAAAAGAARPAALLRGHIPGFLKRIQEVNNGLESQGQSFVPFVLDGHALGRIADAFVERLLAFDDVFELQQQQQQQQGQQQQQQKVLTLAPALRGADVQARSAAVARVLEAMRDREGFCRQGWRDELYAVTPGFGRPPALLLERASAPFFGIRAYGVHINGYVPDDVTGAPAALWVARRSAAKQTWPGKLDHIVAGGQPAGLSVAANVAKECWEEAGVPAELAAAAAPVGYVSYVSLTDEGLKPDLLFTYDLRLPASFVPTPQDGEVEEFVLWPLDKVAKVVSGSQDYKPNCALVVIDFLVRHGFLSPDEPGYVELVRSLRAGDAA